MSHFVMNFRIHLKIRLQTCNAFSYTPENSYTAELWYTTENLYTAEHSYTAEFWYTAENWYTTEFWYTSDFAIHEILYTPEFPSTQNYLFSPFHKKYLNMSSKT